MDTQLFLDVNRAARDSAWAHGAMRLFAGSLALGLVAAIVLFALFRAWRDRFAGERSREVVGAVATVVSMAAAFGLAELLAALIARPRPYAVLAGVEVLVTRVTSPSLPSVPVAIAAASAVGLVLARRRACGVLAGLVTLALCYARVYVGAEYPADVLAALGLGLFTAAAVVLLAGPLMARLVPERVPTVAESGALPARRGTQPGPAARPTALAPSGAVRVLSDHTIRPAGGERAST